MKHRGLVLGGAALILVALLGAWIMSNTTWEESTIPTPLRGEAAEDPFYAAKALVRELGGEASSSSYFEAPATRDVIFLADWNWTFGDQRRLLLEQWVESGGRLVMDESVFFHGEEFTAWNGIDFWRVPLPPDPSTGAPETPEDCRLFERKGEPVIPGERSNHSYVICGLSPVLTVTTRGTSQWRLHDERGMLAVRVAKGLGSVTVIRGTPFWWRSLLDGDHAELFVAMTQLRRGDHVHFLSESGHPSLPALAWRLGWPALLAGLLALALALWRAGVRFGPLLPASPPLRRSLMEQIRGTGRFLLRNGAGSALHGACVRALEGAARTSIPGFDGLKGRERAEAIAAATGTGVDAVAEAIHTPGSAGPRIHIAAIMQVESLRRRILSHKPRRTHGS